MYELKQGKIDQYTLHLLIILSYSVLLYFNYMAGIWYTAYKGYRFERYELVQDCCLP